MGCGQAGRNDEKGYSMKRRVMGAALMVVIGVGAAGFAVFGPGLSQGTPATALTATVARTNVTAQVAATGSVSAPAVYGLSFGADPELTSGSASGVTSTASASSGSSTSSSTTWLVKVVKVAVGDTVSKGRVLATADSPRSRPATSTAGRAPR
jgi:multidrug efflux pump subunit AcrA (membrane-fusion protein)